MDEGKNSLWPEVAAGSFFVARGHKPVRGSYIEIKERGQMTVEDLKRFFSQAISGTAAVGVSARSQCQAFYSPPEIPDLRKIQEVRIRVGQPIILHIDGKECLMEMQADSALIRELLEIFSKHSLYAYEDEIRQGYLTIEGGHRVGIAGKVVLDEATGRIRTIKDISALTIRIAHERIGCADRVIRHLYERQQLQNTLLISPPGAGKTTLLRDVIRQVSDGNIYGCGRNVSVVDERSELGACFRGVPQCDLGMRTDVMAGCPKAQGMLMMIRSMAPEVLAVDEIGSVDDLNALRQVMKCGCGILATVHGDSVEDLRKKPVLNEMLEDNMFTRFVVLSGIPKPGTVTGIYKKEGDRICAISEF